MSYPPNSKLVAFLAEKHKDYFGKVCELREVIEGWLSYIPNTFPHYTRHTIDHSDEIVAQISNLLFSDDGNDPQIGLSGVEAYILVAGAYLHDAGMVTPDQEKLEILSSDEWKDWTSGNSGGAKRWSMIEDLRVQALTDKDREAIHHFNADVQTRFLVADFVRSRHHLRSGNLIEVQRDHLARIDFGDQMLRRALAAVCVGHGLRLHELEDRDRYPDTRDIRGERANVRFLAALLRLGDLLDMRSLRACPMLIGAASPLPMDSLDHWIQYQAIAHRSTTPEQIEITAECPTQDVHTILQDWCQWIVDEVAETRAVMPKCRRHSNWRVPEANMLPVNGTIVIKPAEGATYKPSRWQMYFDKEAIVERLTENLYSDSLEFVRELLQNALDAIRCRMSLDLEARGEAVPKYPTSASKEVRDSYRVKVSTQNRIEINPFSGEEEDRTILVVEDDGVGMDREIIEKFFLQIGRSFYTSDEFRRTYHFFPTSRFGIGFLSVFTASEKVIVETFKPSSSLDQNAPIRLTLTGVKNYLLHEDSRRSTSGTRIEIVLNEILKPGMLVKAITKWCRRVEFPVEINDFGAQQTLYAESSADFVYERPLVTKELGSVAVRAFDVNREGIEGEIYVFEIEDENGPLWGGRAWSRHTYPSEHALAEIPPFVDSLTALHGITVEHRDQHDANVAFRIDYRNNDANPNLGRNALRHPLYVRRHLPAELSERLGEILIDHFEKAGRAQGEQGWKYKQSLVDSFDLPSFWRHLPATLVGYQEERRVSLSLNDILSRESFDVVIPQKVDGDGCSVSDFFKQDGHQDDKNLILFLPELKGVSRSHTRTMFRGVARPHRVEFGEKFAVIRWTKQGPLEDDLEPLVLDLIFPCDFGGEDILTYSPRMGNWSSGHVILINAAHPFYEWMNRFEDSCAAGTHGLSPARWKVFLDLFANCVRYRFSNTERLTGFLASFEDGGQFAPELVPPAIDLAKALK
jgi:hypothetical protein